MDIKIISKKDLLEADRLQQSILNKEKKKRYRIFSYIKKEYYRNPNLFVGCYINNKLIGIIFGYVKKSTVILGEMALIKEYRKQGIGRQMVSFFETQVRKLKKKKIILGSRENAEYFYIKQKYSPIILAQIKHNNIPKDYKNKNYKIIKETNYKDAKRLFIKIDKFDEKLLKNIEKAFNAYNAIYLFEKNLQ